MVGETRHWPSGPSARENDWRKQAAMLAAIIVVVAYIIFVPEREDLKLLPQVSGCYLNHQHRVAVIVDHRKILRADGVTMPIALYDLKWGGARLLPTRRLVYEPDANRIAIADGDPRFIDTDRFFQSLMIVGNDRQSDIDFVRVPCPAMPKAAE